MEVRGQPMGVCKSCCINKVTLNLNNDFIRYIYKKSNISAIKAELNVKNNPNFSLGSKKINTA